MIAYLVALAGCDRVFGLHEVGDAAPGGDGAGGDTSEPIDVPTDPCPAAVDHDEDDDGIDDACDDCPVDPDPDQVDSDNDDVGDVCDPHPNGAGDRIVVFAAFTQSTVGFQIVGPGTAQVGDDDVVLTDQISLQTTAQYLTTRIQIGVEFAASPKPSDRIELTANTAAQRCIVDNGDAACTNGGPCLLAQIGNSSPGVTSWPSIATTDTMQLDGTVTNFTCRVFAGTDQTQLANDLAPAGGSIGIITDLHGVAVVVHYLIAYGT